MRIINFDIKGETDTGDEVSGGMNNGQYYHLLGYEPIPEEDIKAIGDILFSLEGDN